jgi:hypothetical protein
MNSEQKKKKMTIALIAFLGCLLLFTVIGVLGRDGFTGFLKSHFAYLRIPQNASKLQAFERNYPFFMRGLAKAIIVSALCIACALLLIKKRLKPVIAVAIISFVLLVDLWVMGKRFLVSEERPSVYYKEDGVVSFLKQDSSLYRVFPLQYRRSNDGILIIHGIQSLGGYHPNPLPNPLRRYQELVGSGESVMFNPFALVEHPRLLSLLNAKYLIGIPLPPESLEHQYDENTREIIRHWRNYYSHFTPVRQITGMNNPEYVIYRNDSCLPRAFFVEDYRVFNEKEALLSHLRSSEFDPQKTVLLEEEPGIAHPDTTANDAVVSMKAYGVNRMEIEVATEKRGFLLLSENFFPRWRGFIDGEATKVYLADYALRAVIVPEGKHTVEFRYEDSTFGAGKMLHLVALVVLMVSFAMPFVNRRKQKRD